MTGDRTASVPRPWATIVVFAVVGPLVGFALVVGPGLLIASFSPQPPGSDPAGLSEVWFALHPLIVMFAYLLGGLPALLTGIGTVLADRWMRSPGLRFAAAALIGAVCAGGLLLLGQPTGISATDRGRSALVLALIGSLSAIVCAHLTRRWRYNAA